MEAVVCGLPKEVAFRVCYQSRVGPVEWIKPYTDVEIEGAGAEEKAVILVPISFVSEHSETLVEMDKEYQALAEKSGVVGFYRVPTPRDNLLFMQGLADLVRGAK